MNVVEAANLEYSARGMNIPQEVKSFMSACRNAFVKGANWREYEMLKVIRKLREEYENDVKNAKDEQDYIYASGKKDALIILQTLLNDKD